MAESITSQRGLIPAGGDKEPGSGGQAVHGGVHGMGSSLFLCRSATPFSPSAHGGQVGAAGVVPPAEPWAAAPAGMEDAWPHACRFCHQRCRGWTPVATLRMRATRCDGKQCWGAHPTPPLPHICSSPLLLCFPAHYEAQCSAWPLKSL